MQILTRPSSLGTPCMELQEWLDASLVQPASTEPLNVMVLQVLKDLSSRHMVEGKLDSDGEAAIGRIPVVSKNGISLMPCRPTKAKKLLRSCKAIKKWSKLGMFYIQLAFDPGHPRRQPLAIGIDPGSKFEGFSVVGTRGTVLNLMSKAVDWVKKALERRRNMRRARRYRKTRRRKNKSNKPNNKDFLPPSTKVRWDVKLRIVRQLCKFLSLQYAIVEDIQAVTKQYQTKWNRNFSPLEVGKHYFYSALQKMGLTVIIAQRIETKRLRELFGLKKRTEKATPVFEAHCGDAWVSATAVTGAHYPTTRSLYYVAPLHFHRRQLHRFQCAKGGIRRRYGGTISLGLKKGTLVHHTTYGMCYVGSTLNNNLSLHCIKTGKRLTQKGKHEDMTIVTRISFRTQFLCPLKQGISLR